MSTTVLDQKLKQLTDEISYTVQAKKDRQDAVARNRYQADF